MGTYEYKKMRYDSITFWIPKGNIGMLKAAVAELGVSQSEFIRRAIGEFIASCSSKTSDVLGGQTTNIWARQQDTEPKITATERRLLDTFNKLSPNAQKSLLKFLEQLGEN